MSRNRVIEAAAVLTVTVIPAAQINWLWLVTSYPAHGKTG
jgi:hypothetical protein